MTNEKGLKKNAIKIDSGSLLFILDGFRLWNMT
jgi:hypothetical protein